MEEGKTCGGGTCMAPALLRWALGLLFLVGGLSKLPNLGGFVNGYLVPAFENTFLPAGVVMVYGYVLPVLEVLLGIALILGVCRTLALSVTGLTLISLAFGQLLLKEHATVANIFIYVAMVAAALYMGDADCWVLGGCRKSAKE